MLVPGASFLSMHKKLPLAKHKYMHANLAHADKILMFEQYKPISQSPKSKERLTCNTMEISVQFFAN